jgi:hypothetical protein
MLTARRGLGTMRRDVAVGDLGGVGGVAYLMPLPDLGLPQGIEALDGVFQARLARWREHRHHAQRQAQAAHAPDGISKLARAILGTW